MKLEELQIRIYRSIQNMPPDLLLEVNDFVEFLKEKRGNHRYNIPQQQNIEPKRASNVGLDDINLKNENTKKQAQQQNTKPQTSNKPKNDRFEDLMDFIF